MLGVKLLMNFGPYHRSRLDKADQAVTQSQLFFLFSDSPLNLILCIVSRQNIWRRGRDVKKINSKLFTYLSTRTNI